LINILLSSMEDNRPLLDQDSCLIWKMIVRQLIKIIASNMKIIVRQLIKILLSKMKENSQSVYQEFSVYYRNRKSNSVPATSELYYK